MKKDKITFTKEKELNKQANEAFSCFVDGDYAQNPIKAKFLAFKKVKKQIDTKELF